MTQEVKEMLQGRFTNQPKTAFVFPAKGGGRRFYVPNAFEHVVKELGKAAAEAGVTPGPLAPPRLDSTLRD